MSVKPGLSRDVCGSCGSEVRTAVEDALSALGEGRLDLATSMLEELLLVLRRSQCV